MLQNTVSVSQTVSNQPKNITFDIDNYVDNQLQRWAAWYFAVLTDGLGYPKRSVEGALLDSGGVLIRSTRGKSIPTNEDAEQIDKLLCELGQYKPELASAVKIRYTSRKIKTSLESLKIPYPTYKVRLQEGLAWLAGNLTANYRYHTQKQNAKL